MTLHSMFNATAFHLITERLSAMQLLCQLLNVYIIILKLQVCVRACMCVFVTGAVDIEILAIEVA